MVKHADTDNSLTWRQEVAAAAMACGLSVEAAGKAQKIDPRTIQRWKRIPAFVARVTALQREATTAALGKLIGSLEAAHKTLNELLTCEQPAVRLGAAKTVFEMTLRVRDHVEILDLVRQVEQQKAGSAGGRL